MSDVTRPLYLHGAKPHHIAALKAAKATLNLDYLLKPVASAPGQGARTLAFGGHPGWVVDSVLVTNAEMVPEALKWALGFHEMAFDGYADKLGRWMGAGVKEVATWTASTSTP